MIENRPQFFSKGFDHESGATPILGPFSDVGKKKLLAQDVKMKVKGSTVTFTGVRLRHPLKSIGGKAMPTFKTLKEVDKEIQTLVDNGDILLGKVLHSADNNEGIIDGEFVVKEHAMTLHCQCPEDLTEETIRSSIAGVTSVIKKDSSVRVVLGDRNGVAELDGKEIMIEGQVVKLVRFKPLPVKALVSTLKESISFLLDKELPHTNFAAGTNKIKISKKKKKKKKKRKKKKEKRKKKRPN